MREPGQRQILPRDPVALGLRHAAHFRTEADIVEHGLPGKQGEGLKYDAAFRSGPDDRLAVEIIVGTSGIGFLMFDARRAGSTTEILLGMIILGLLWYIVDAWILAPLERATGQRWGLVTS
jgi:hypothetical protein